MRRGTLRATLSHLQRIGQRPPKHRHQNDHDRCEGKKHDERVKQHKRKKGISFFGLNFPFPGRKRNEEEIPFSLPPYPSELEAQSVSSPSSKKRRFQPYKSMLKWALRHRLTTLGIALAFFIASLMLIPGIPKGFVDDGDLGISTVSIELPPGSTLLDINKVATQGTNLIRQNPAVESVLATEEINSATLTVKLKPRKERKVSQKEFEVQIRPLFQQIAGARISFKAEGPGDSGKELSIVLRSENPDALLEGANALEKQMRSIPGLVEVSSTASLVKPEILVIPDPQRAADLGVTVQSIARTASLATIGDIEANLAKYNLPDRQIPIRVQIDPKARTDINT
ncbi:MAG: efflux RND transporter permease subunit, partial [Microcoleus sp. T3-bin5]|nr:efflux RND transporter permease subunit [Microcoleus sp. T3-bin5]